MVVALKKISTYQGVGSQALTNSTRLLFLLACTLTAQWIFPPNDKLSVFMEVEHWKPRELVDQLLACSLAESSFDMLGAEQLDETAVTKEIRKLRGTIEAYSNGGFELIEKTISDNPDEVLNDDFFVKLLISSIK